MKILRFDSVGGASGDMILAALIDLGVEPEAIQQDVASLGGEPFAIIAEPASRMGIHGTRAAVRIEEPAHDHPHHHRHLADIRAMIGQSRIPEPARRTALAVFERLAEAEAKVHGTTPDRIHFHEVGAMDSIVDIVGACVALHLLDIDTVTISPLPVGCGTVACAHGVMPLPVPATAELLRGFQVRQTAEPFELVTPTGAALLTTWAGPGNREREENAPARVLRTGYGVGHRELSGRANVLRATLLETDAPGARSDDCLVLECNLDDMTPELIGSLTTRLLETGALDAFVTAVQMKKQRPGALLTVLARPESREAMLDLVFRESTTFGVREYLARRTVLERRHEQVPTPFGPIGVKIGAWRGHDVTRAPEHADCVRAAETHGVPVRMVYEAALRRGLEPPRPGLAP